MDSFLIAEGFVAWHPFTSDFELTLNAYNRIKRAVNNNHAVLLGLRSGYGSGHQVLAYGFDKGTKRGRKQSSCDRIYVYDPNKPNQEYAIILDQKKKVMLYNLSDENNTLSSKGKYDFCFVQAVLDKKADNWLPSYNVFQEITKPIYLDLSLVKSIYVNGKPVVKNSPTYFHGGDSIELKATIRNIGEFDTEVESYLLWARDPNQNNRDNDLGMRVREKNTPKIKLSPGKTYEITKKIKFSDTASLGIYRFGVSYKSKTDEWVRVPLAFDGSYQIHITLSETTKNTVDASFVHPNSKAYFFHNEYYKRFDIKKDKVDNGYPKKIKDHWGNWPSSFNSGIDAAVYWADKNKIYFFKENSYIRYAVKKDKVDNGYPLAITRGWKGVS